MHADLSTYLDWLRGHGVEFAVAEPLMKCPDHDGPLVRANGAQRPDILETVVERRDPEAGMAADHASDMIAACLTRPEVHVAGKSVWDVGCGTGVLMVAASRCGAARVFGTDIDPRALRLTSETLAASNVEGELFECSLFDAVPTDRPMDLVVANLPHKPCPDGYELPTWQRGGPDGVQPHAALVEELHARLAPGAQVLFFLHSLPHPRLLQTYAERFDLALLGWKRRFLQDGEYGALESVFDERAERGASLILHHDDRRLLVAGAWLATRR